MQTLFASFVTLVKHTNTALIGSARRFGFVSACTGLLLTGCSQFDQKPLTPADLKSESEKILNQAIDLQSLLNLCQEIGSESGINAGQIYEDWHQQNWDLVVGADEVYRQLHQDSIFTFQGREISLEALNFYSASNARSTSRHRYLQFSRSDRAELCASKMSFLSKPIELDEPTAAQLRQFASQHSVPPTPYTRIPSLAAGLNSTNETGRSFYQIERQMKDHCSAARVITLESQWPKELYAAFCDMKGELVSCHWGDCQPVQAP